MTEKETESKKLLRNNPNLNAKTLKGVKNHECTECGNQFKKQFTRKSYFIMTSLILETGLNQITTPYLNVLLNIWPHIHGKKNIMPYFNSNKSNVFLKYIGQNE